MLRLSLSCLAAIVSASACKTPTSTENSATKDIGLVNAAEARTSVLYEEAGQVLLRVCTPAATPPLTRDCPTNDTPKSLGFDQYIERLPIDTGPYQRNQAGLDLASAALEDARAAVAEGNEQAIPTVERLEPIYLNLSRLMTIKDNLPADRNGLTYYEYQDEFSDLVAPFSGIPGAVDMAFVPIPGRRVEIQTTEVTRGQWKAVMGQYPEENEEDWHLCRRSRRAVAFNDHHPVSCIYYHDIGIFASRLTDRQDGYAYRLPTNEEWSAIAGNVRGLDYGWCNTSSTNRVGALLPFNGLHDIAGNVAEWTSTQVDYSAIVRGSSFETPANECTASASSEVFLGMVEAHLGFRLVRTPTP